MSRTTDPKRFVDECLAGRAMPEDVDDWLDLWDRANGAPNGKPEELDQFLGMTEEEYFLWAEKSDAMPVILAARRNHTTIAEVLIGESAMAVAARESAPGEMHDVLKWLIETGQLAGDNFPG